MKRLPKIETLTKPITEDLKRAGVPIDFIDLVKNRGNYEPLSDDVFIRHLEYDYPENIKLAIVTWWANTKPVNPQVALLLLKLFRELPSSVDSHSLFSLKGHIAQALAEVASEGLLSEIMELIINKDNGVDRMPLLFYLGRFRKNGKVNAFLEEFVLDPLLGKTAESALRGTPSPIRQAEAREKRDFERANPLSF